MASAMVEITSGSTPWRMSGSTMMVLKIAPSTSTDSVIASKAASENGKPSHFIPASAKKAGSMTNSPWAKLIVCDACQSRVNPTAASA